MRRKNEGGGRVLINSTIALSLSLTTKVALDDGLVIHRVLHRRAMKRITSRPSRKKCCSMEKVVVLITVVQTK